VTVAVAGIVVAFLSNLSNDSLRLAGGSVRSPTLENQGASSVTNQGNPVLQPQQLEKVANDLASLRQTVERLAARQDEMERNVATLQASIPRIQSRRHLRNH
jgi:ubiquinone biosynthesis protein UbiJ